MSTDGRVPTVEQALENPHLRHFVLNESSVIPEWSDPDDGLIKFHYSLAEPLCAEDFFGRIERALDRNHWTIIPVDGLNRHYRYQDDRRQWNSRKTVAIRFDPIASSVYVAQY